MTLAAHWYSPALAAACFAGVVGLGAPAQAGEAAAQAAVASGQSCDTGHLREGKGCMHQIAPAGACATARQGTVASGGGGSGGDCGDAIGAVSARFTPATVALSPGSDLAFNPPAPGPPPGPDLQPGEIGGGGGGGPPGGGGVLPPPPVISVIESPAPIDPLPGLLK